MKKVLSVSFSELLLLLLFFYIILFYGNSFMNGDTDILWHIRQGDWYIQNKKILMDKEIFTYQFNYREWVYLSWLSNVISAILYKAFSFRGIVIFTAIIISIYIYIVYRYLISEGIGLVKSAVMIMVTLPIISLHWLPRPFIYSYLFMAIWFIAIDKYCNNKGKKLLLMLPLLQIVWVNCQSSFIYGYIVGFLYMFGEIVDYLIDGDKEKLRKVGVLSLIGGATFLTSVINPFGFKYYIVLFFNDYNYMYSNIMEFLSIDFHRTQYLNYYILSFVIIILFFLKKKIKAAYMFLIIFWLYSGIEYIRHAAIFGFFAIMIIPKITDFNKVTILAKRLVSEKIYINIAKYSGKLEEDSKRKGKIPVFTIFVFILAFILTKNNEIMKFIKWDPKPMAIQFGIKGTEYIKNKKLYQKGKIYNAYLYGGYMIWEMYPERVVFMDPRASIYPKHIFMEHKYIYNFSENTFELLDRYDIKYLFLEKTSLIAQAIRVVGKDKYKEIYKDNVSIIYEKIENFGGENEKNYAK